MHGCCRGACVVAPGGHVWLLLGGHLWLLLGGGVWDMTRYGDTINQRTVRILLECILVILVVAHPVFLLFVYVFNWVVEKKVTARMVIGSGCHCWSPFQQWPELKIKWWIHTLLRLNKKRSVLSCHCRSATWSKRTLISSFAQQYLLFYIQKYHNNNIKKRKCRFASWSSYCQ